jgi:hypothetical protein
VPLSDPKAELIINKMRRNMRNSLLTKRYKMTRSCQILVDACSEFQVARNVGLNCVNTLSMLDLLCGLEVRVPGC